MKSNDWILSNIYIYVLFVDQLEGTKKTSLETTRRHYVFHDSEFITYSTNIEHIRTIYGTRSFWRFRKN